MTKKRIKPFDLLLKGLVYLFSIVTAGALVYLVGYILVRGIPHIKPSLFALHYTSDNVSVTPAIITTLMIIAMALLVALPVGIGSAIYLTEYAGRRNKLVKVVRTTTETLAGIPSIVYGLFGYLFFLLFLRFGYSILAGAMTLAIMILPLIMRTTEEAILAVSDGLREGSFALGAGRLTTIVKIILPSAMPGIFSGIVLAVGRIVGESAALLYTAGTVAKIPGSLFDSGRTLAIHLFVLSSEGLHTNEAFATAVVLMLIVVLLNFLSGRIAKKWSRS